MLKVILGIVLGGILTFVVLAGGCAFLVGKAAVEVQKQTSIAEGYTSLMSINKDWRWEGGRPGGYSYVRGRVTNNGSKTVRYWKITARFLDKSGNVLDSTYANSIENLRPGESKAFEMMERYDKAFESASVSVDEVRLD